MNVNDEQDHHLSALHRRCFRLVIDVALDPLEVVIHRHSKIPVPRDIVPGVPMRITLRGTAGRDQGKSPLTTMI